MKRFVSQQAVTFEKRIATFYIRTTSNALSLTAKKRVAQKQFSVSSIKLNYQNLKTMSSFKMVRISHNDYLSGKYQSVSSDSSNNHEAKVWYNSDGSINEELTYSYNYQRANGIGRYAKKAESSSKSSSSSKGSSSKDSSSKKSTPQSSNRVAARDKVRERKEYVYRDATDEERLKYITRILCRNTEFNITKTNAIIAKAASLGLDPGEALADLEEECNKSDFRYLTNDKGFSESLIERFLRNNTYPPTEREELLEYISFLDNFYKKSSWDRDVLFNLFVVIALHHENDIELQNIVKKLRAKHI